MNIKTHIPIYCPKCGKIVLSIRAEYDPKEAVIAELVCGDCTSDFSEIDYFALGELIITE